MKEYHIGIDCGTSNSCVGIYKNGKVIIVPNKLGERTTPSVVCFNDQNKVLVGEETISQKMDEFNKIIYEVKRFIGLSYQDFIESEYDKNLNYEVVNKDGIPKIRININGNESFYSAEDITSLILQKMVKCAEDFIEKTDKAVKINKAIITVPAHFTEQQKEAMRRAARNAGIEIPRIINEPTAAALAYGIGKDLSAEQEEKVKRNTAIYSSVYKTFDGDVAPPISFDKSSEKAIVFDLGGGTLDITLLNITKNSDDNINFEILGTDGDIHLGGSDFDNKLIDYCINEYCKQTGDNPQNVRQNKRSCKRLKIKCENAKKLLSISRDTIINVENFIGNNDLFVQITRELFDDLCFDLYERIETLINGVLDDLGIYMPEIDNIILVGGSTRIIGVRSLLYRLFGEKKVKDSLNPDEAVAYGATLESAKMEEKSKINFILQDISAYKIGIANNNPDPNDKEGDLMYSIIKKFSKIPVSNEKQFRINLTKEYPYISIKIYEGNDKYVNKNTFLGEMKTDNLNKLGIIEYSVKFDIDVNGQLTVTITVDSLGIKEQEIINKVTHAYLDIEKKKIKICKSKKLSMINEAIDAIRASEEKLSMTADIKKQLEKLQSLCNSYQDLVQSYLLFIKDNELVYEKIYMYTKELFDRFIQILKLKGKININIKEIIEKIKEHMSYLISSLGYVDELLDMFKEIKEQSNLKNEYYEIFINYIELLNKEGFEKKGSQKFSRYYSKLYFERAFYSMKKNYNESDFCGLDETIKERFNKEKMKAEAEYKKINSFTEFIERKIKDGVFLYGNTGFTMIGKKIERFEKDMFSMTKEELQDILDIFKNMSDSFDKTQNSIGEAYCISNVILINYTFYKKGYKQLWPYINRFNTIINIRKNENYEWIANAKEIIEKIG